MQKLLQLASRKVSRTSALPGRWLDLLQGRCQPLDCHVQYPAQVSLQGGEEVVVIGLLRDVVDLRPGDPAIGVDDEDGAFGDAVLRPVDAVLLRDGPVRDGSRSANRTKSGRAPGPRRLRWLGVDADPEHGGIGGIEAAQVRLVAAHLGRADRRERERMKRHHDLPLAAKVGQFHRAAAVAPQLEIRGLISNLQRHRGQSPLYSCERYFSNVSTARTRAICQSAPTRRMPMRELARIERLLAGRDAAPDELGGQVDVGRLPASRHRDRDILELQPERRRARLEALGHADDRVPTANRRRALTEVDIDVFREKRAYLPATQFGTLTIDRYFR